jgi:hypothetical protein
MLKSSFAVACVLSLIVPACVDSDLEDTDFTNEGRLVANALTPQQLYNATLASTVLDATSLHTMAATADGRASLIYVVGCALATNHNVSTTYDPGDGSAVPITFRGEMGLADGWTSNALTTTERGYVSSCTLARVNKLGTSVTVSMRGALTQFATTSPEVTGYPLQEGAFFGDVFAGSFFAGACKGSGNTTLSGRECAKSAGNGFTNCDYRYAGTCSSVCTQQGYAFTSCTYGGTTYNKTVTTYLTN